MAHFLKRIYLMMMQTLYLEWGQRCAVWNGLVGQYKSLHFKLIFVRLTDDDFEEVSGHGHVVGPDHLIPAGNICDLVIKQGKASYSGLL